jgi:hypothetical protein
MPKSSLSVTLDEANLLWLKGRAALRKRRSLSDALDEIVTAARTGGRGGDAPRSVVGTVDIADDDPELIGADAAMRTLVEESIARPFSVRERSAAPLAGGANPARKPVRRG